MTHECEEHGSAKVTWESTAQYPKCPVCADINSTKGFDNGAYNEGFVAGFEEGESENIHADTIEAYVRHVKDGSHASCVGIVCLEWQDLQRCVDLEKL